jgi:hypothetical protein
MTEISAMPDTSKKPSTIFLLFHVIGKEATQMLTKRSAFGGTTLLVPKGEEGKSSRAFAAIAEVIGMDAAHRLCRHFGGGKVYIPVGMTAILLERDHRIVAAYNSGVTINQLAAQFNLSDRHIYLILKKTDMSATSAALAA